MRITVNGEPRQVEDGLTVQTLLERLEVSGRVAVELNAQVLRRALHAEHRLAEGDAVEIVTFVGGG